MSLARLPGGSAWLSKLPQLVVGCVREWRLTVHAPIQPGSVSWVAHTELPDGTPAILKLSFPDEETRHEPDALSLWAGRGAGRLYEYDRARHAMLLERCIPGAQLWSIPNEDAANRIADILRRLWRAPPAAAPFRSLAHDARRWSRDLPARYRRHGRPFPHRLLDEARSLCVELRLLSPTWWSATRTSLAATYCPQRGVGSRSTQSRWSANARLTSRRCCAIDAISS